MRIALFVIVLCVGSIVSELKTMPNSVIALFLLWAGWALACDYYKSLCKAKGKNEG